MKDVPIVTAATAWICLETGQTHVLVFHEGMWMRESMPNSLINYAPKDAPCKVIHFVDRRCISRIQKACWQFRWKLPERIFWQLQGLQHKMSWTIAHTLFWLHNVSGNHRMWFFLHLSGRLLKTRQLELVGSRRTIFIQRKLLAKCLMSMDFLSGWFPVVILRQFHFPEWRWMWLWVIYLSHTHLLMGIDNRISVLFC